MVSSNLPSDMNTSPSSNHDKNDAIKVSILSEALPYIQKFAGRRIVIKYGGSAMAKDTLKQAVFRDIALLSSVGAKPIIVDLDLDTMGLIHLALKNYLIKNA